MKKIFKFLGFTIILFILNFITLFAALVSYSWAMDELEIYLQSQCNKADIDYDYN